MTQTIHVTQQPVVLEGYQAVLKPSKFGYSLSAVVDQALVDLLAEDRVESLKWAESKLRIPNVPHSNPNRGKRYLKEPIR
jgi:hypothetical protein